MIYEIISKNDVPISQMHIYLKNKTCDDGGIYPELFNDLSLTESVNGLYAFAIACVITKNFTDTSIFLKGYATKEVATLALIQYIKGVATTVQLNSQCVNPRYENLANINQLGMAPSLLNLDGDLFYKHYDESKYFSKEAADAAEDSFPYWVINTVKEIKDCTELVTPTTKSFELPYYIQNISDKHIAITKKVGTYTQNDIIGTIPPSGIEPLIDIIDGVYGVLGSSERAYVYLSDDLQPIKHVADLKELDTSNGTLKLPAGEFDVLCKKGSLIVAGRGITKHYLGIDEFSYKEGDTIHIKGLFRNAGIIADGIYIQLHSDCVSIVQPLEDHTKNDNYLDITATGMEDNASPIGAADKYAVIIKASSIDTAKPMICNILKKSEYKSAFIDVDTNGDVSIFAYSSNDQMLANKAKKKILALFGYKATVMETNEFYKK